MLRPLGLSCLPASADALRPAVRAFLDEALRGRPTDRLARSWMGFDAEFSRALAQRGWVGMTLPAQYGGGGKDAFHRFVLAEELLARGAPVSAHWIADRQSGPLLLKYGRYILLTREKFGAVDRFFTDHGEISTFTGRFIPVVRHFISFPAGLARMNLARFCLYTALGSCIWSAILTYIGYLVGNNIELVKRYMHQVTILVLLALVVVVAVYVKLRKRSGGETGTASG